MFRLHLCLAAIALAGGVALLPSSIQGYHALAVPPANPQSHQAQRIRVFDGGMSLYRGWLQEDVAWIITDEERKAFRSLTNDEQRDNFIEAFWQRRDPTP